MSPPFQFCNTVLSHANLKLPIVTMTELAMTPGNIAYISHLLDSKYHLVLITPNLTFCKTPYGEDDRLYIHHCGVVQQMTQGNMRIR